MMTGVLENRSCHSSADISAGDLSNTAKNEATVVFNEQTNYVPRRTIITTTLASSLSIIGNALGASNQTSWISGGYFVTSTCFQLLYGKLSDIWSRKLVLFVGLGIFFIGSLAASLAQTATQLIVFRALTGVGGGGLMTVAQTIVSDIVPLRERGKYQGILGAVVAIANGIGPVIGGALASISQDSWRWIFRLNLPLTVVTTLAVFFFMPLRKVEGDWKLKLKAIDFVVGFAISVAFVVWQWKGARVPLVPIHIFKGRIVNGACLTMFINGWNFLVQIYYIPTFYQLVFGYSTVKAGAMLLPITLMQTASSTGSGLIVHWVGRYRECILFGWMIWAVGLGLFSTLDESSGVGKQIGYGLLTGVGVGNTLQPSLIAVQAGVDRRDMAVVTSFRNFVRNLGGTIGLAIAGTIINNILSSSISTLDLSASESRSLLSSPQTYLSQQSVENANHIRSVLIPAYQKGFRIIFIIGASLAALAFFLAFGLMPQLGLKRTDDEALKKEGEKRVNDNVDEEERG
ncbi:uncharacterized protein N7477_001642 [Penicillium maclennaniae]|uniref:uncharacterized protein n=1 Tax=Penicillium maclennaniae TaxID=1343394 RepID=UPI0025409CF8|nr:uncharacterized protein N7477_001642 [Penicillium maclennaniae]KAJ5681702.1 hypothetical protein N7477_001642 [Penicillium maclennaniae]